MNCKTCYCCVILHKIYSLEDEDTYIDLIFILLLFILIPYSANLCTKEGVTTTPLYNGRFYISDKH